MRITFVLARADLSGGVRVVAIYADRLRRRGHDVTVVSSPPRRPTLRERARSIVRRRPLPSDARRGPSHLDGCAYPHHVIDRHRPIVADDLPDADVVLATWWETAEWVAPMPPSKGAKAYFLQHYEAHAGQPVDRVDATWRLPLHKITIAQWLVDLGRERFGDADIDLIMNSVDLEQFRVPPRGKRPAPTVGFMYSHVPFKGSDLTLAAYEVARARMPDLRLVAFGNRTPTYDLPLPPATDYTCRPPQHLIKDIYARCDAWVVASRAEGNALPLLEAMACRTPVVATPAGAAPEHLSHGGGILVPHEEPAAIADAIVRICSMDEPAWRGLSEAAHDRVTRYTWDDATDLFEAALHRVAAGRGGAEVVAGAAGTDRSTP